MSIKDVNASVPETYQGREQAYIKHELLKAYLEKLFFIIGRSASKLGIKELGYVDCFSGPWDDETDDLSGTSIAISLQKLDICRQALGRAGISLRFRALYVEKDERAFQRLEKYLSENTPSGIEAKPLQGNFVELRDQILKWYGSSSFVFFFIDPTGWKEVGIEILQPLLRRPQSEFLINFMYDFINRTASMSEWKSEISALLGEDVSVSDLPPVKREALLLNTYRDNLKRQLPVTRNWPARSAYVRVLDRHKKRPKYHLVYLTCHPRGVIEFMKISEEMDQIQKRIRASIKQDRRLEKSGTPDLFGAHSFVDPDEGHVDIGEVEKFWVKYLSDGTRQVGEIEFAEMIERTDWFPNDFQRALKNLMANGKIRNLDAKRTRPKNPLHWQNNERLQLVEGS